MAKKENDGFSIWSLLIGVVYIIVGILAFTNPISSTGFVVYLIAFTILFKGLIQFTMYFQLKKFTGIKNTWLIVIGVIDVLIGIFLFFNVGSGIVALPILFAIWFIVDSIFALLFAFKIRSYNKGRFWSVFILSIASIILGFLLIYNPIASLVTIAMLIGTYFIINGISHIIQAF